MKRIRRLMRLMRLMPIYQKPNTSKPAKGHKTYPYLLGGLRVDRPNQVWCADITYLPMRRGLRGRPEEKTAPPAETEAWAAYQEHEARQNARCAFFPDYTPHEWEEAWRSALEHLLDNLPTPSVEGIAARLGWMDFLANRDFSRGIDRDKEVLAALRADFEAIAAGVQTRQPKSGRTADKAAQVRDLRKREASLSDRAIARRVGCSPQTVGNWRRRLHQVGRSAA